MDIFSNNIQRGDLLTAETFQNIETFLKGSSVAGGSVSAQGINVPSEFVRNPRIVRFVAEEEIQNYSIIELTEQVEDVSGVDNQVPTFKAKPATGDAGTLFYTEFSFADQGESGMAYSIGGEPILIRSSATADGSPKDGEIVANVGGAFRYLSESDVSELKWFLPVQGGGISEPKSSKVRLVQPKELFPACEYKSEQDVYDCKLEYSDTGGQNDEDWHLIDTFVCGDRGTIHFYPLTVTNTPHQYWRVNLKGYSKDDSHEDRGFVTFGRLWDAAFWINNESEPTYIYSEDETIESLPFDSKPVPRKTDTHRMWTHTFDQPELVTHVMLEVEYHLEHHIVCPGGRDKTGQDVSFIYSFDLATEKWMATTFPELHKPMFNMDAKIVELADESHQLVILSGECFDGFSDFLQGYNFEKDHRQNAVNIMRHWVNFAGRPALMGDPMMRGSAYTKPENENDFAKSLIVVGGSKQSTVIDYPITGTNVSDTSLFFVAGKDLEFGKAYRNNYAGYMFNGSMVASPATVEQKVVKQQAYTRHQNLPVRGILRRRPVSQNHSVPSGSTSVVDFLLIGGFNSAGHNKYDKTVLSGILGSPASNAFWYTLLTPDAAADIGLDQCNIQNFITYPNSPYVLGDCCAEYVEERDEIICFGGRATQDDAEAAHANLAVLVFDPHSNAAAWNYQKYPNMPHPRWSAASVLVRGLVRKGETVPCDRVFIIGGRNREGFVPEVDVFNLRYNEWETDWKGLLDGELENYTPEGGGTIIIGGGGDGVQSVKAGDNVKITGSSQNPVINAYLTWG